MSRLLPQPARQAVLLATLLALPMAACDSKSSPSADAGVPPLGGFGGSTSTGGSGGAGGAPKNPDAGGGTSNPDAGNEVPIAKADPAAVKECTDEEAVFCTHISTCAPGVFKERYGDMAGCMSKTALGCANRPAVPGSTITADAITACIAAQKAETCADFFNNTDVPACDFKGSGKVGASCTSDRQCATGYCAPTDAFCGVCANPLALGQTCKGGDCAPGLICNDVCLTPGKAGEMCDQRQICGIGLYCSAGKCTPEIAMAGAPCTLAGNIDPCSLAMDLVCDMATSKCVSRQYVAKGGICTAVSGCHTGGFCGVTSSTATMGTCQDLPGMGEQCDPQNLPCAEPYRCLQASQTTFVCDLGVFVDPAICQ
jgi:hypothetical protein